MEGQNKRSYTQCENSVKKIILERLAADESKEKLAKKFNITLRLSEDGKPKKKIVRSMAVLTRSVNKSQRRSSREEFEERCLEFLRQARDRHHRVTGPTLCTMSLEKVRDLGLDDFKAFIGWRAKFKSAKANANAFLARLRL